MIIAFHGENTIGSRKALIDKIDFFKRRGGEVIRLDGKKANLTTIKQACETKSFFSTNRLVVIEEFFSQSRSRQKTKIENYFKKELTNEVNIIFWEQKKLTPLQLRQLPPRTKTYFFKIEPIIFKFLDSLRPGNSKFSLTLLQRSYKVDSPEMIFYMLCRQIRLLIIAKDAKGKGLTGMPFWMKNKFISQSRYFSLEQLLAIHRQLLKIDYEQKTGQTIMPLSFHLDLLVANL